MGISPSLFTGQVMHKRLFPKVNDFTYGMYYLSFPVSQIQNLPLKLNTYGVMSFYERDHASKDGRDLEGWARDILKSHNIEKADGEIILICMPRIFGYVFNPVSFWMCLDKESCLRAVICEVNNTFSETHSYLCAHDDQRIIEPDDIMTGNKIFHVSPFLKREGHYEFRFNYTPEKFGALIDFYDGEGKKQLITSLIGRFQPMTKQSLRAVFWRYPLITFKAISLIHWQAVKIVLKGIKYIPKPKQMDRRVSTVKELKKIG